MRYLLIVPGARGIVAASFAAGRKGVVLEEAYEFADAGDVVPAECREFIASRRGARLVLCLPPAGFAQRHVSLPLRDLGQVREVLPAHLETPLPAEELVFDALAVSGGQLALWARRAEIAEAVRRLDGCEPDVVTCAAFAWAHLPGLSGESVVSDGEALAVVRDGRLEQFRPLGSPLALAPTLAAMEEAGVAVPQRQVLLGASQGTEPPAELIGGFDDPAAFRLYAPLYAVVAACRAGVMPNFHRGRKTGDSRHLRTAALLACAACLATLAAGVLEYRFYRAELTAVDARIATLYRGVFPGRGRALDEVGEIRGALKKLGPGGSAARVLDSLLAIAAAKGAITLYEAEIDGSAVRLKGEAPSSAAAADFRAALGTAFASPELAEVRERPGGSFAFTITAGVKGGAR